MQAECQGWGICDFRFLICDFNRLIRQGAGSREQGARNGKLKLQKVGKVLPFFGKGVHSHRGERRERGEFFLTGLIGLQKE
jgi:hypothetical protein